MNFGCKRSEDVWCHCYHTLVAVLFSLQFAANPAICEATENVTINELREISKACRQRIRSLDVSYTINTEIVPHKNSAVPSATHRVLIDTVGLRSHFFSKRAWSSNGEKAIAESNPALLEGARTEKAWDGRTLTEFKPQMRSGTIDPLHDVSKPPYDLRRDDRYFSCAFRYAPSAQGLGIDDASLESFLEHSPVISENETIFEQVCTVVSCFAMMPGQPAIDDKKVGSRKYATLWLSPDEDFMIRKLVVHGMRDDRPSITISVQDTTECVDSSGVRVWLPLRVEVLSLKGELSVKQSIVVDADSLILNPAISDSDFAVKFPDGTIVYDKGLEKPFVVGNPDATFSDVADLPQESEDVVGPTLSMPMIVLCNVLVVSVIGGLLYWRKWRG